MCSPRQSGGFGDVSRNDATAQRKRFTVDAGHPPGPELVKKR
jgi:hypothetical protein